MKKALLDQILRQCYRELPKHPQLEHFAHWTYLVQDNKIISYGVNRHHEPPKKFGYHNVSISFKGEAFRPKWHSELDAVKRCRGNVRGCTAVNVRLNKSGQVRMSMPCAACRNLLYVTNVKKVYFTTEFGWGSYAY